MARKHRPGSALLGLLALLALSAGVARAAPADDAGADSDCIAEPSPGCPATGTADLPLPCEGNCRSYAHCQDGTWEKWSCFWPWLRFSPKTNTCVLQIKVDCDWWKPKTTARPRTTRPPRTSWAPVTTVSPSPGECGNPECPRRGKKLLPDPCPDACQRYYSCDAGKATPQKCLPWQNFDPHSLRCVFWDLVDCTWANPTTPRPPCTTTASTTTQEPTAPTTLAPCTFIPVCPSQGVALIADPCRCQAFYKCSAGNVEQKLCLPWQNFDPISNACVLYDLVDCDWPKEKSTSQTEATDPGTKPTEPPTEASSEPQTEATQTQPETESTEPVTQATEPQTEATDPQTEATAEPETEATEPQTEATVTETTETYPTAEPAYIIPGCKFVPDCPQQGSEDVAIPCKDCCNKYVACRDGKASVQKCTWPQHFDSVSKTCVWFFYRCAE